MNSLVKNTAGSLRKKTGYLILNIGGLAIGIASFLFITLYVINELTYDRFFTGYKNIYRIKIVGQFAGGALDQAITAAPMAKAMLNDYPEVLKAARLRGMGDWLIKYGDRKFNESGVIFADSTLFDVFDYKLLKGDPRMALVRPRSMVLTQEFAKKYFGDADPVGQRLNVESDTVFYTVTGVMQDVPDNSHLKFDMVASLSTYPRQANSTFWVSHNFYTYITVKEGTDIKSLQDKFQDMVLKYVGPQIKQIIGQTIEEFRQAGNDFRYILEPVKDIHLKGATQYNREPPGSLATIYIFGSIAILILIVAVINYINLATAKSASRAKEVGIRKVSGASKAGLITQFLTESLLITFSATVLAFLLLFALLPSFNNLAGRELSFGILINPAGLILLALFVIVIAVTSGFYPAFVLASFAPTDVLKGTLSPGSMSKKLRSVLVVFQFTVSIVIIIGSIIVNSQLNFMTRKDIGFEKENLLVIKRADAFWRQTGSFRTRLLEIPGVEKVGFTQNIPGSNFSNNAFFKDNDPEMKTYLINQGSVSFDFPEAMGIKLIEGRIFSRDFGTDSTAVLINEATVRVLGLKEPVAGQYILAPSDGPEKFTRIKIIGVMKDFNIESMHKAITPVGFRVLYPGGGDQYAVVRLSGTNIPSVIRNIEQVWQEFTSNMPFQYEFFTDRWNSLYEAESKTGKIFLIFSFLAIFIACLGLIGLVTYMTNKRTKEIGVRKSYGASSRVVLALLSREVFYLIAISSLLAYPAAFFGSRYWLEGFASRISVSPFIYLAATLITLAVGWLAISYQTIKAAGYNPANALRVE
jgi:putative ABC transport system permease protein